jgi:lipoate-protein ligase A
VSWRLERLQGSVEQLHRAWSGGDELVVRCCEPSNRALVLGSSQSVPEGLHDRLLERGYAMVRRRSGGGSVLVVPGELVWVDIWVPTQNRLSISDVRAAAAWAGELWMRVLSRLGLEELSLHEGPIVSPEMASLACFAGIGPGEVSWGGKKVVGISQRRSRQGALFHTALVLVLRKREMAWLLAPAEELRQALELALEQNSTGLSCLEASQVVSALEEEVACYLGEAGLEAARRSSDRHASASPRL